MVAKIPIEIRMCVITAYEDGQAQSEIADRFEVSQSSVSRLIRKFVAEGHVIPVKREGSTPILTDEDHSVIREIVKNENDLTLLEISKRIKDRLGKCVSQPTVHRVLKKLNLRRKKKTRQASERDRPDIKKKRVDYIDSLEEGLSSGDISVDDWVFLDEAGAKLGMSCDDARAEGGERAVAKEPKNQGKNISMVGAIGVRGVVAMMYCLCTVDAMGFATFIDKYLVPNLRPGQIVIMDNVNFHTTAHVKSAIEAAGARVVFLPAYSPEFNPIEQLWSKLKTYLKSKMPESLQDFHDYFIEALSTVTEYDCEGWFENSGIIQYQ